MGHLPESLEILRFMVRSKHPCHRLAGIQLGAAYASQGKHELAGETYATVLTERPHHAAALAGIAEAAYWRGKDAVPIAVSALTPAVERATKTWTDDAAVPLAEDEDEGEDATGFQRLQVLIQWATLSLIEKSPADFACVAVPLVSVALGQLKQRQEFELRKTPSAPAARSREAARESRAEATKQGAEAGPKQGEQFGRRAIFWHIVEVVRSLLELGNSAAVKQLVDAACQPNGLLRGLEKEDLKAVVANPETAVLSTMPGGSPLQGPAAREGVRLGPTNAADLPAESKDNDALGAIAPPPEQFYPPPWRCVEEKDNDGFPRRAGRPWRPTNRAMHGSLRRSRSRLLKELDERKDDGDAIGAIVRALSRRPGNDATWNLLQRVVAERGMEQADGGFDGEQVEALVSRHRERPQGLLYRGHDAAVWNRAKHALRLYSHAHTARPEEPLPILCLATHICRMVTIMETMVENEGVCVLQALACLHRYA
ncbi:unnamed protein product, partial [Hapterophycus canaliculatus]